MRADSALSSCSGMRHCWPCYDFL